MSSINGEDTEKACFSMTGMLLGSVRRCLSAERKPVRVEVYGTTSSVMYDGACPFTAR